MAYFMIDVQQDKAGKCVGSSFDSVRRMVEEWQASERQNGDVAAAADVMR